MPRLQDYPDLATHRKRSILPPALQTHVVKLCAAVRTGGDIEALLSSYVSEIKALPAAAIVRAAAEIPDAGRLYRRPDARGGLLSSIRRAFQPSLPFPGRKTEERALRKHPSLAYLYIIHGDGRLREAALRCLSEPPDSPIVVAALTYRLNDWAEQVRDAARDCAGRLFPDTQPA